MKINIQRIKLKKRIEETLLFININKDNRKGLGARL